MRITNRKRLHCLFLLITIFYLIPICCFSKNIGLIGEDLFDHSGVVLTVNEYKREAFLGGLRAQGPRDQIHLNVTLVNTGRENHTINPLEDFYIELNSSFKPSPDANKSATVDAFQLFPTMQTRINLYFIVDAAQKSVPSLFFKISDNLLKIICDTQTEKAVKDGSTLSPEEAIHVARVLLDAEKFDDAKRILLGALIQDSGDPFVLMMLARVEDAQYEPEAAASYLGRIRPSRIGNSVDAYAYANMAMKLDYPHIAINILQDFFSRGELNNDQKLLLARAYYSEEMFREAEYVLLPLISSGTADKLAHFTMGNVFNLKGDLNRAIHQWEMAIDVDSQYAEAYFNIGVAYFKKQDIERAREYWRKVLVVNPDSYTLRAAEDALKATEF
ncbi:MAG: tetratricopeptide repeat protein [Candidatus Riflebacteria bacterium]|nr:tetratricopeptide repeat protein [Candidatus Riflebacteria bacterium]